MDNTKEVIERVIEDNATLKADVRWLKNNLRKTQKNLSGVETVVLSNQKILHGFFIAGGIILAIITALSPILKPILVEAIK